MAEPRWLDPREARAWRTFLVSQARLRARISRQLQQETGLSEADYEVLVHLSEARDGRLRAFELGRATDWEKSRLSHHLTRMARRGLVSRERCPTDSRGSYVVLTGSGWETIRRAAPRHVEHVRHAFVEALGPEQLEELGALCQILIDHLGDTAEPGGPEGPGGRGPEGAEGAEGRE